MKVPQHRFLRLNYVLLLPLLLFGGLIGLVLLPAPTNAQQVPSGIVYSVPITISNSQSVATPTPFQQMVVVNSASYASYEAPSLQNVEFFDSTGATIPSWLESGNSNTASSTVYWLKIANGIPASSSLTLYMGFSLTSTNLFNSQTTGEAPTLSSTYAQYDDGPAVFNSYFNFAGASLPPGWNQQPSYGGVTVNNGLSVFTSGNPGGNAEVMSGISTSSGIIEGYVGSFSNGGNSQVMAMVASSSSSSYYYLPDSVGWQNGLQLEVENNNGGTPSVVAASSTNPSAPFVLGVYGGFLYLNYKQGATINGNILGDGYLTVGANSGTTVPSITYNWIRVRGYPPNGMMPSVSVGQIVATTTTTSTTNTLAQAVYNITITVTNSQPIPTPAPFQQMISVDSVSYAAYEAPNLQNVWFSYPNGVAIPSWLESGASSNSADTVYWLKLASGVPADSSVTIHMDFASPSVNVLNSRITGEAPQLSPTYGEYDNGANIFANYENFNASVGSGVPPGWYDSGSTGSCSYVSDRPGFGLGNVNGCGVAYMGSDIPVGSALAVDIELYKLQTVSTDWQAPFVNSASASSFSLQGDAITWFDQDTKCNTFNGGAIFSLTSGPGGNTIASAQGMFPPMVLTVTDGSVSSNYTRVISGNYGILSKNGYLALATTSSTSCGSTLFGYWVRTRSLPPNGVMPSVSGVTMGVTATQSTTTTSTTSTQATPPTITLYPPTVNGLAVTINGVTQPSKAGTTITGLTWQWGDGQTTTGFFPQTHTYAQPGSYTVTVSATDSMGLVGSSSETVDVHQSSVSATSQVSSSAVSTGVPVWAFDGARVIYQISLNSQGGSIGGIAIPSGSISSTVNFTIYKVNVQTQTFEVSAAYSGYFAAFSTSNSPASFANPSPFPAISRADLNSLNNGGVPAALSGASVTRGVSVTVPAGTFTTDEVSSSSQGTIWIDASSGLIIQATGLLLGSSSSSGGVTLKLESTNIPIGGGLGSSIFIYAAVAAAIVVIAVGTVFGLRRRGRGRAPAPAGEVVSKPAEAPSPETALKIARLKQMLDSGLITQADYEEQKKKLTD